MDHIHIDQLVDGKINVVTSFYPLYDFTQKIGGEHVNVINLIPTGVEPHDWLSPLSALKMAENIKNSLVGMDSTHQADYEANFTILSD